MEKRRGKEKLSKRKNETEIGREIIKRTRKKEWPTKVGNIRKEGKKKERVKEEKSTEKVKI